MLFRRSLKTIVLVLSTLCSIQPLLACTPPRCYGTLSAGMWRDSDGVAHISAGSAYNYPQDSYAQQAALNNCYNDGGLNCSIVAHFGAGECRYIAVGSRDEGVQWGSGSTPQRATDKCEEGGYSCNPPIGGCNAE